MRGEAGAGADAAVDVIFEAWAWIGPGDALGARAVGEQLFDQVHGLADAAGAGEGPEIAGAVLMHPPGYVDPGEVLGQVHFEVGVGLVILEADVEIGPVALDEGVLKDEGLGLGVGDDVLEIGQFADHAPGLPVQAGGRTEVGAEAVAEDGGLADIDHRPGGVFHQIDAGAFRGHQEAVVEFLPNHSALPASGTGVRLRRRPQPEPQPARRNRCRCA